MHFPRNHNPAEEIDTQQTRRTYRDWSNWATYKRAATWQPVNFSAAKAVTREVHAEVYLLNPYYRGIKCKLTFGLAGRCCRDASRLVDAR